MPEAVTLIEVAARLGVTCHAPVRIVGVCAEKTSPRKRREHAVTEMVVGPTLSLYTQRHKAKAQSKGTKHKHKGVHTKGSGLSI